MLAKLGADKAMAACIIDVLERRISPYELVPMHKVIAWTFGALVRGKFGVLPRFFAAGKFQREVKREVKRRRKLAALALPAGT